MHWSISKKSYLFLQLQLAILYKSPTSFAVIWEKFSTQKEKISEAKQEKHQNWGYF